VLHSRWFVRVVSRLIGTKKEKEEKQNGDDLE